MALIGNRSVLLKSPGRYFGGSTVSDNRSNFGTRGSVRCRYFGGFPATNATPTGYRPPYSWVMAIKNGEMSSTNAASVAINASGLAVGGITTTGTASLSIDFSPATAALIASGAGSAAFTLSCANALLTASIGGTGSANFTISATGQTGALASGTGTASMTITFAAAQPLPLNDASPIRTGAASFAITGSLIPYAKGIMSGSTVGGGALSESSIAAAVWANTTRTLTSGGGGGGGATAEEAAAAVRAELATELARIDVATSTRATAGDIFAAT